MDRLVINSDNDRHGPTPSEADAINWLFLNKSGEMRNLAKNIANAGQIFDSPLVVQHGENYLVKDGNRRVTCLKLLANPSQSPEKFRKFFEKLKAELPFELVTTLNCQFASSDDVADQIIGLRHNGTQGGIGQLNWGIREKANHANRTNGKSDYSTAQMVENFLIENGYEDESRLISRSNLEKLIDTKARKARLGLFNGQDGILKSAQTNDKTLALI
ncbi:MAG: hypothetical protein KKC72_05700, partial [Alphaproteobacteria bacterium]|nr:hypothetical protein [Alphaproteobacteria bacterium]